jgi:hypothetical protein
MEDQAERNVKRLERLGRLLMGAVLALIICDVLLLVLDFAP